MISIRKVASFIDDVIVGTEEKIYDKVVKNVVKILAENDLYITLEKYKWKVRKVRFLKVVIGLERIKIKEKTINSLLRNLPRLTDHYY